jgi:hypothetical protein
MMDIDKESNAVPPRAHPSECVELTRQAYMDGELSVEEVIAFEASCNDAERREVAAEQAFERAFVERVSQDTCPDALWDDLRSRIARESRGPTLGWRLWPILAAAALLTISGLAWMQSKKEVAPSLVADLSKDLHEYCAGVAVPGDFEKVRSSLTANGFHIKLSAPDPEAHHAVSLLGVSYHDVEGSRVAELKFSCCQQPVSVFVSDMPAERLAELLQAKDNENRVYNVHEKIDTYQVHAVSTHLPDDVLNLFS